MEKGALKTMYQLFIVLILLYFMRGGRFLPLGVWKDPLKNPIEIAEQNNLTQKNDEIQIIEIVKFIVDKFPEKINEYKNGKPSLIGFFMGRIMKKTKANVNAKIVSEILKKYLNNI